MEINKDSQVKLLNMISQTVLLDIDDLPIDVEPNRIKEKKESLNNTLQNRLNIPMIRNKDNAKVDVTGLYNIIACEFDSIDDGNSKPINVKDTMLQNMKNKAIDLVVLPVTAVDNSKEDSENIDNLIFQLNDFTEVVNKKVEQIKKMKSELEESDILVQELSVQYTEVEKKLREAELRNDELEQMIISKLNEQKKLLTDRLNDMNELESEMEEKKKNNEVLMTDFKNKINMTVDKTNTLNQGVSKKEEILKSIDSRYLAQENDELDMPLRKVA